MAKKDINDALSNLSNKFRWGESAGAWDFNLLENCFQMAMYSNSSKEIYMYTFYNYSNPAVKIEFSFYNGSIWNVIWQIS